MTTPTIIPADMARALLEAATPGPWMHNWRGPEDGAPGDLWHTGGCGGPLTREADWELAARAPDLAASVVALHAEVTRLQSALDAGQPKRWRPAIVQRAHDEADHDYREVLYDRDDRPIRPTCAYCGRSRAYCKGRKP